MPFPYTTPQEAIDEDVFHDIDVHKDFLIDIAKGDILEIGVRQGFSTACFLLGLEKNGGHLYSVDIRDYCVQLFPNNPLWTFIEGDSRSPDIESKIPNQLDVLFIDGDHSYEGVQSDLATYGPMVKHGGSIILHDVVSEYDPGVRKAVDEYVSLNGYELLVYESWVGLGQIIVP